MWGCGQCRTKFDGAYWEERAGWDLGVTGGRTCGHPHCDQITADREWPPEATVNTIARARTSVRCWPDQLLKQLRDELDRAVTTVRAEMNGRER